MKNLLLIFAVAFLMLACKKDNEDPQPPDTKASGTLVALNYLTQDEEYDFLMNDSKRIEGVAYAFGGKSAFEWDKSEGKIKHSINVTAGGDEVFSANIDTVASRSYLSILVGPPTDGRVILSNNDTIPPAATEVKLRFLHAYQNISAIDIYVGGTEEANKVISNLAYAGLSNYVVATEADLTAAIIITETGVAPNIDTNLFTSIDNASHDGGNIYIDAIASQTIDPTSKLSLFIKPQ